MEPRKLARSFYCGQTVKPKVNENKITNEPISKLNTNMKAQNQTELTPVVAPQVTAAS